MNDALRGHTRRAFLIDGTGMVAAGSLAGGVLTSRRTWARVADLTEPAASQVGALRAIGRSSMRLPDSRPNPAIASATDTLPQIEHVVVLMVENHSYDNFLGMLGCGAGQAARGDGFTLAFDGLPNATNPYANGQLQRAFHMPTTCHVNDHPSQEWQSSHIQYDSGTNQGFVISPERERVGFRAEGWLLLDLAPDAPRCDCAPLERLASCQDQLAVARGSTSPVGDGPALPV